MGNVSRKSVLLSATALFIVTSVSAFAADAPTTETKVEKVTVTATRRKTELQKTPVAVTAVGEQTIKDARVENIEDLMAVVPSLQVTNGGNPAAFTMRIRGVGTQGNNAGLEAAVGTFIDGVYRSRASVAFGDLGELERIEVLRGPQGTLFGRNTSAGILSVITKKPTFDGTEIDAESTFGSFDQYSGRASINFVPVADKIAIRLFGTRNEQEGFIDVNPGRPDAYDGNAKSYFTVRGQAFFQLSEMTDLRLIADYADRADQCCSAATLFPGGNGRAATIPFPSTSGPSIINFIEGPLLGKGTSNQVDEQVAFGNRSTNNDIVDKGVSAEFNVNFGWANLTSITAARDWETTYAQDSDFSGADILYFADDGTNLTRFETFTHEMRLTGDTGQLDWLLGVFVSNEDITRRSTLLSGFEQETYMSLHRIGDSPLSMRGSLTALFGHGAGTPVYTGGLGQDDLYKQNSSSFAVFTHNVVHFSDDVNLSLGLRYTEETKTFDATYDTNGQGGCTSVEAALGLNPGAQAAFLGFSAGAQGLVALTCLPGSRHALDVLTTSFGGHHQEKTEREFSGVMTLAWEVEEDVNTYATYSRGHKAGGFNLDRSYSDSLGSIVSGSTCADPDGFAPFGPFGCAQTVRAPDTSFAPEFVDAYELGLKMTFDDGKLLVNTAAFYQDFQNFQLNTFTGVSFIVTSVPEVISQGLEIESSWRTPIDGLSTNLAVQYTDAHYGDIGSLTTPGSFIALNPGLFALKDATITHSPEWTVTGGLNYKFPLFNNMTGLFHTDARWQGEMNTGSNLDPRKIQKAFAVVGAKFGIYTDNQQFGLEFFARNLLDEKYINTAFDAPLQGSSMSPTSGGTSTIDAFLGEPRMMGITLSGRY
ncbi:MAG: TonB-dependent receptor [Alphaproteobacteria bacterium]|nr:TonB-dependent receptor [Alphaproteobacteria bacterium]